MRSLKTLKTRAFAGQKIFMTESPRIYKIDTFKNQKLNLLGITDVKGMYKNGLLTSQYIKNYTPNIKALEGSIQKLHNQSYLDEYLELLEVWRANLSSSTPDEIDHMINEFEVLGSSIFFEYLDNSPYDNALAKEYYLNKVVPYIGIYALENMRNKCIC